MVQIELWWSDKEKLYELRRLNKENIIFNSISESKGGLDIIWINSLIMTFNNKWIFGTLLFFEFAYIVFKFLLSEKILFNIDKDEFEVIKIKSVEKYKKSEVEIINLRRYNDIFHVTGFKKGKKNYKILVRNSPFIVKLYNTSLTIIFN